MKYWNWFLDHCWPFSTIRFLRHGHALLQQCCADVERQRDLSRAELADYKKQAEWWYTAVRGELTREQLVAVQSKIDREAEAECTRIGNIMHAADSIQPVFPPKGSGQMDPKLSDNPLSPAANAVRSIMGDPTVPKMDDLQRDWQRDLAKGGPIKLGDAMDISAKKEDK